MTSLETCGHKVLILRDREKWLSVTSPGLAVDINPEAAFLVIPNDWHAVDGDEEVLVFLPGPLGADTQVRAPKSLFVEITTREDGNGGT